MTSHLEFMILGRDWIYNQDNRSSYIKDWGKVIMKFRDNYACVNLVTEGVEGLAAMQVTIKNNMFLDMTTSLFVNTQTQNPLLQ